MMGLGVAYRLARAGQAVTLYEAADHPGGVSTSFRLGPYTVDRFYHTILPGDATLLALIDELGHAQAVQWRTTRTGFAVRGKIHPVSNLFEFLRFSYLTPWERFRLGWALLRARRITNWQQVASQTCAEWLTAVCGRSVYEKLWRPLLAAKLGSAADRVSATFIWSTITRLQEAKQGSGVDQSDKMGFLSGGYQELINRLVTALQEMGVVFRCGKTVQALTAEDDGAWAVAAGGNATLHDQVVSTLPVGVLDRLLTAGAGDSGLQLRAVDYLGAIAVVLLLDRPLGPYYILNWGETGLPFTGVIEMTNLAPPDYFAGQSVVYLPRYLERDDDLFNREDEAIVSSFLKPLPTIFPHFDRSIVREVAVQRAPYVQPIHTLDYQERIPPAQPATGLWIASSAMVHPYPLNNNLVLSKAYEVADLMLASLAAERAT